jgi:hypothetical protein
MSNPGEEHLNAAKYFLRYLKQTKSWKKVHDCSGDFQKSAYIVVDASLGLPSISGGSFQLCGASIHSWSKSIKCKELEAQPFGEEDFTSMHSSCEAEYYAIDDAARWGVMFRNILKDDFGLLFVEIPILSDNTSACTTATGAASQFSRMMHVSRRQHHIRDCLRSKFFRMQWHPGEWNPADALTKRLGKKLHMRHASVLLGFETINGLDKPLNPIE